MKLAKVVKRKRMGLHSKTQTYRVSVVTEKGEELTYRIARRRGICKIDERGGVPYTHIKISSNLRVNARIALYSQAGAVNGTITKVAALDTSTDVDSGDNPPPIRRPGGH